MVAMRPRKIRRSASCQVFCQKIKNIFSTDEAFYGNILCSVFL